MGTKPLKYLLEIGSFALLLFFFSAFNEGDLSQNKQNEKSILTVCNFKESGQFEIRFSDMRYLFPYFKECKINWAELTIF